MRLQVRVGANKVRRVHQRNLVCSPSRHPPWLHLKHLSRAAVQQPKDLLVSATLVAIAFATDAEVDASQTSEVLVATQHRCLVLEEAIGMRPLEEHSIKWSMGS